MGKLTDKDKKKIIEAVFKRIREGESMRAICRDKDIPTRKTIDEWIKALDLVSQYTHAREERQELIFEDILNIADDNSKDKRFQKDGTEATDQDVIQRSRVRIDARKWMLGKMNPKRYGDKVDITSDGDKLNGVTVNNVDLSKVDTETLKALKDSQKSD